ncbi:MAG: AP2 domain-containing protein [Herbinix sp.]|nr:AP2 domain-containing protein [Herbinix sp.]
MGNDYIKKTKDIYFYNNEFHNDLDIYYDKSIYDESIRQSDIFKRWYDMHYRCYSVKLHERYPSYIGCSAFDEWKDFGNYYEWHKENHYEIEGQKMDLDKDILVKGNKIYSPETCIFVPHEINTMFINGKKNRGEYPVGVSWDNSKNRFRAQVKSKKLGTFKTAEQAFAAYKAEKEKQIKELAKKYKGLIPDRLYDAMVHWKIEITD